MRLLMTILQPFTIFIQGVLAWAIYIEERSVLNLLLILIMGCIMGDYVKNYIQWMKEEYRGE